MTVAQAFQTVAQTQRFDDIYKAYERALGAMVKLRPNTPIIGHNYSYPLKLGVPANLTIANIGLIALLKKHVRQARPAGCEVWTAGGGPDARTQAGDGSQGDPQSREDFSELVMIS